jgi:hypothetical protein
MSVNTGEIFSEHAFKKNSSPTSLKNQPVKIKPRMKAAKSMVMSYDVNKTMNSMNARDSSNSFDVNKLLSEYIDENEEFKDKENIRHGVNAS